MKKYTILLPFISFSLFSSEESSTDHSPQTIGWTLLSNSLPQAIQQFEESHFLPLATSTSSLFEASNNPEQNRKEFIQACASIVYDHIQNPSSSSYRALPYELARLSCSYNQFFLLRTTYQTLLYDKQKWKALSISAFIFLICTEVIGAYKAFSLEHMALLPWALLLSATAIGNIALFATTQSINNILDRKYRSLRELQVTIESMQTILQQEYDKGIQGQEAYCNSVAGKEQCTLFPLHLNQFFTSCKQHLHPPTVNATEICNDIESSSPCPPFTPSYKELFIKFVTMNANAFEPLFVAQAITQEQLEQYIIETNGSLVPLLSLSVVQEKIKNSPPLKDKLEKTGTLDSLKSSHPFLYTSITGKTIEDIVD